MIQRVLWGVTSITSAGCRHNNHCEQKYTPKEQLEKPNDPITGTGSWNLGYIFRKQHLK